MASWEMFVGDLYPPLPMILSDSNGPINIAAASVSAINLHAHGTAGTISGACTNLQVSFTGNLTQGSNQITSVSSTTGLWVPGTEPWPSGSTLYSSGNLPAPTGSVGNWTLPTIVSISGTTITMSQNALATGTGVTIIANMGTVQYSWVTADTATSGTFNAVAQIVWLTGTKTQTVPNTTGGEFTIQIDALP